MHAIRDEVRGHSLLVHYLEDSIEASRCTDRRLDRSTGVYLFEPEMDGGFGSSQNM